MFRPAFLTQVSSVSIDPPDWLDENELQQIVRSEFETFQKIENFRCRSQQNAQRVQIQIRLADNSTRTVNFQIKSKELETLKLSRFQLELHMHKVVLPALESLYKDVQKKITFTPSSYVTKTCLYLKDLQAKDYRLVTQPKGLDHLAMQVALSKLAAYHAASACYLQTKTDPLNELLPSKEPAQDEQQLRSWLQRKFHESLRANDLRHYEDKVKFYQKTLASRIETPDPKKSFNVLLNGACWSSNLLGQFDAFGQLKDVVFNDFGRASVGPAIHDLLQLLLTAPAEKTERFDGFLRYYVDELTASLKLLKFKGKFPTLTDLQLELLNHGHWAVETATESLPIVLADLDCADSEELFKSTIYSKEIQKLLPWLENRGYFEVE